MSSKPSSIWNPEGQPWVVNDTGLAPIANELLTPQALRLRFRTPPRWVPEMGGDSRPGAPLEEQFKSAAVLVPLVERDNGLNVLLTQRTAHLNHHPGQIAFPGGRAQPSDVDPVDTALRETEEETGLTREHVDVLGTLPHYLTASGFEVTPVVGLAEPSFELAHDPFEVADVFEVPLAFLMNPANYRLHTAALVDGVPRRYYSVPYGERFIWGATAGMLRNLYHMLRA